MKPNLSKIPPEPGVYLFSDKGKIIYIGKAKNLKHRVNSYWASSTEHSPAKQQMVSEVARVDFIVVNNEKEALLLEAGLIKKHQPKYNIVMRDDKNWAYIIITKETFPRIMTIRGRTKRKGERFGPYTKAGAAKTIVRILHRVLPLRTCQRDLSKIPNGLVCMQYHLGNCEGPCEEKVSEAEYTKHIEAARQILKGDTKGILSLLQKNMANASLHKKYEQAALYRNKIQALASLQGKQDVVHPLFKNQDIIGSALVDNAMVITIMQLRHGQLLDTLNYLLNNVLQLNQAESLEQFLAQYYGQLNNVPKEVILPTKLSKLSEQALGNIKMSYPKQGRKKRLLDMAQKNAWNYFQHSTQTTSAPLVLYNMKEALGLEKLPRRIECFDISNIAGQFAVGSMVVAENAIIKKGDHRKFKIKTIKGSNDVAMMKEVLERRQKHSEWPEPDLIVLDGGKPQLNTIYPILKKKWQDKVIALAKREEEIFIPGRKQSIQLTKKNPVLLLLMKVRDEAHRTAIAYYRLLHKKGRT